MNPLPPTLLSRPPLPAFVRPLARSAVVVVASTLALVTGCGPGPAVTADPRPSPTERASPTRPTAAPSTAGGTAVAPSPSVGRPVDPWLLLGSRGDLRLARRTLSAPDVPSPIPDLPADTRWASGDLAVGFVASSGSTGRLSTLEVRSGRPAGAWRRLSIAGAAMQPAGPSFPTLSPDGRRVAATLGDPASGAADVALLLIDRTSGRTVRIALYGRADGRPPAWLRTGTVVVPILERTDAPTLAIVDTTTGAVSRRPSAGGAFAASGDGRVVAVADRGSARVRAGPTTAFRDPNAWASAARAIGPPDDAAQAAQLLLDRTGSRLAVAWLDAAGDPADVTVYERADDGWETRANVPLPGGTEVVVLVGFDP